MCVRPNFSSFDKRRDRSQHLSWIRQIVESHLYFFGVLTPKMPICHPERQRIMNKS